MGSQQPVILCIDDNAADLELQRAVLQDAGYEVHAATDTRLGLAIFMREQIDLVLLDYNLPRTDGGIIATEMRRRKPGVKIVIVSGLARDLIDASDADAVFSKSRNFETLLSLVGQMSTTGAESRQA